jgi:hypothetical protein
VVPAGSGPATLRAAAACADAATGLRRSAHSAAGVAPAANWFDATAQLKGKVKGVPVASYCKHGACSTARFRARIIGRQPKDAPPMSYVEEEEQAASEAPREPPAAGEDDDDDLYAQPQVRLAHRLALDGVAEVPAHVQAPLVQRLHSIYGDDYEYIKLPEAMERAFDVGALQARRVGEDVAGRLLLAVLELVQLALVRDLELRIEHPFLLCEGNGGDGRGGCSTSGSGCDVVGHLRLLAPAGDNAEDAQQAQRGLHGRAP